MTSMHRPFEDVAAMLTGTLMVALGYICSAPPAC